ncbi:MAG: DNA gyrase modulator, partial [Nitrospirota bacterium]
MSNELIPPSTPPIKFFDKRFGLDRDMLDRVIGRALGGAIDYADLYAEYRVNESFSLDEGIVKQANRSVAQGAGLRALSSEKTGYAYTDEITLDRLMLAARQARAISQQGAGDGAPSTGLIRGRRDGGHELYALGRMPTEAPLEGKLAALRRLDEIARSVDPRITNV